jgi:mono/diheme cytochrome c family protein
MKIRKIFSKRKTAIGLLAGVYLFTWVPNILADDDDDPIDPRKNIIAIHDSGSDEYNKKCSECHADIRNGQSLEPSIPAAHVAMFDFAPGKPGDDKQCVWCHRTVDLVQGSAGNIRKQVDATLCTMCHGPFERIMSFKEEPDLTVTATQFYRAGLSPTDPDGPALYDLACAACHRNLENSQVRGARFDHIQRAIKNDKGEMGPFTVLSDPEIQALADALVRPGGDD